MIRQPPTHRYYSFTDGDLWVTPGTVMERVDAWAFVRSMLDKAGFDMDAPIKYTAHLWGVLASQEIGLQ